MKIEKITDNKIRVVLSLNDFKDKTIDIHSVLTKVEESQKLFLEILNKAKSEINFDTDGYKLLIETFSSTDDIFICTITKYCDKINKTVNTSSSRLHLKVKRKNNNLDSNIGIYEFCDFEDFCNFCNSINNINKNLLKKLFKNSKLYLYNNTYYLLLTDINLSHSYLKSFNSSILEFSEIVHYSKNFEVKLKEHGKIIIGKNAIDVGIKYFVR